jgi:ATP-dependent Lon protease
MRMLKLPDGRIRILVQGVSRARVESVNTEGERLHAKLQVLPEEGRSDRWKSKR